MESAPKTRRTTTIFIKKKCRLIIESVFGYFLLLHKKYLLKTATNTHTPLLLAVCDLL